MIQDILKSKYVRVPVAAAAVFFLLVVIYMTLPEADRNWTIHSAFAVTGFFGLILLVLAPIMLHTVFWTDYNLWLPLMQLAEIIAVTFAAFRVSVRRIDRKYKGV